MPMPLWSQILYLLYQRAKGVWLFLDSFIGLVLLFLKRIPIVNSTRVTVTFDRIIALNCLKRVSLFFSNVKLNVNWRVNLHCELAWLIHVYFHLALTWHCELARRLRANVKIRTFLTGFEIEIGFLKLFLELWSKCFYLLLANKEGSFCPIQ